MHPVCMLREAIIPIALFFSFTTYDTGLSGQSLADISYDLGYATPFAKDRSTAFHSM